MALFYSPSLKGFYDDAVNKNMPKDSVEITAEQHQALFEAQSKGKTIQPDANGYPEAVDRVYTNEQLIAQYESAAQSNLDAVAKSWGYDSLVSAVSYANSTNPQFKAEAEALIAWRDAYWAEAYTIESGTLPANAAAFIAELPATPIKPTV